MLAKRLYGHISIETATYSLSHPPAHTIQLYTQTASAIPAAEQHLLRWDCKAVKSFLSLMQLFTCLCIRTCWINGAMEIIGCYWD